MKVERIIKKTRKVLAKPMEMATKKIFDARINRLRAKVLGSDIPKRDKLSYLSSIRTRRKHGPEDKGVTKILGAVDHMEDIRDIEAAIERWTRNSKLRVTTSR